MFYTQEKATRNGVLYTPIIKNQKNKTIKFELSLKAYTTKQLVEDVFPLLNCFHISISNIYPISKAFPDYSFIHIFCIFVAMMISYSKVLLPKDS
ncbi:hypothetical protein GCM10010995_10170 [Cysteiniphilum litorale]|uniref:Uncharacterized protein n=1 Tax=Cysteiniphilum litorale TaxID=2056700 RepID=A0A8J3E8F9_9GAMM|nr:hypothetical protein GCM10010995_10170 [Cysteiniphilum litorale]